MTETKKLLEESNSMSGPLGAIAFITLTALARGGAPPDITERVQSEMLTYFAKLSTADCNALSEVAHQRLKDRPDSGDWY